MYQRLGWGCLAAILALFATAQAHAPIHVTHQYANINAQSLIGLPMGDHKTIVDMQGNLHWSQWNLKRRGLDVPFGFSAQMDGAVDVQLLAGASASSVAPLKVSGQQLYDGRFPFVVTHMEGVKLKAEELAFATSVDALGMDVIRVRLLNDGPVELAIEARLSGKERNLPARVTGTALATREGRLVAAAESPTGTFTSAIDGLELNYRARIPAHSSLTLWVKRPYDLASTNAAMIANLEGDRLLAAAVHSWQDFWARGMKIELPEKEIMDFYYSSLAYVFILTERDAQGDLWTLDGPGMYVHYWGRGEYFQARAMEVAGYLDIARQTVEHAFRLQKDDGEWDWPAISGWPAWDSFGGEAGSVWDYYRFSGDRAWLERAHPYLTAAAHWINYHREETELPADAPPGAESIKRQIPWSCKDELSPPLQPGEKPYWWGLLPWGYGDSGLPEGHAFAHNVMALYAVECAWQAAQTLGQEAEATRLSQDYADYKKAILTSMQRAIGLEEGGEPYLPAMPTDPAAAVSQSFLAVYPTGLLSPDNPWVTGLLARVERTEIQGLPTNMAWFGMSGVWPGESMNVAETYLRRGDLTKTVRMLVATLNHSYTTNVWKEEIRVDKRLPVACVNGAPSRALMPNQMGTGDMPEAWGNANLVNLVRDMLLYRAGSTLYVLAGIPADWIGIGEDVGVENAPTTFGGNVSFRLSYPQSGKMVLSLTPPAKPLNVVAKFPIGEGQEIVSAKVNGKPVKSFSASQVTLNNTVAPVTVEVSFK